MSGGSGVVIQIPPQLLILALLVPFCTQLILQTVQYHQQSMNAFDTRYEETQVRTKKRSEEMKERWSENLEKATLEITQDEPSPSVLESETASQINSSHETSTEDSWDRCLRIMAANMDLSGIIKLLILCIFFKLCWMAWLTEWFQISMKGLEVTRDVEMYRTTTDGMTRRKVAFIETVGILGAQLIKSGAELVAKFIPSLDLLNQLR